MGVRVGLELRCLWGDRLVAEHFLSADGKRQFRVGSTRGVDFEMGDVKLGAPSFELAHVTPKGATLRVTEKMTGEVHRNRGEQTIALHEAQHQGFAVRDGDALAIALQHTDSACIDLGGGIVVEASFKPEPKRVTVPFSETLDFTTFNAFFSIFLLAAAFIVSAVNVDAEGESFDDKLDAHRALRWCRIAPQPQTVIPHRLTTTRDSGDSLVRRSIDAGEMRRQDIPTGASRAALPGDARNEDANRVLAKVFGSRSAGMSAIFGHHDLGTELGRAMGNMVGVGVSAGDSGGLAGLSLRGSGPGVGEGDTIGIGGVKTKGRDFASGVGVFSKKQSSDISVIDESPVVLGSLDKQLIRTVIHSKRGQIRYCYESQLSRYPTLAGKVAVKFVINSEGAVSTSSVAQSTASHAELDSCIVSRVRTWVFPKPKGGGVVIVTYPFIFSPSGGQLP